MEGDGVEGVRWRGAVECRDSRPGGTRGAKDHGSGTGDGATAQFQLVKADAEAGGDFIRRVERPVEGSVLGCVEGVKVPPSDVSVDHLTGMVTFRAGKVPPSGAAIRAGFEFDVPVRFAIDRIDVNLTAFEAGRIPSIPLMEILP